MCCTSFVDSNSSNLKRVIKIMCVHSYDETHVCTGPQQAGFIKTIFEKLSNIYILDVRNIYLETNDRNTSKDSIRAVSQIAMDDIEKFNPDYIYTSDDTAFQYVGIPMSLKYKIFFSGLNKPFELYSLENPGMLLNNFYGVNENIDISNIFKIFQNAKIMPNKFILLTDDGSETGYYMTIDYKKQLDENNFKYDIIPINTVLQFRKQIQDFTKNEDNCVFILITQRLFDSERGIYVNKDIIAKELIKFNKKFLELGGNPIFSKFGISMCCAPNFYLMGVQTANLLVDYVLNNKIEKHILNAENIISINSNRLRILGYSQIIDDPNIKDYY